MSSRKLIGSLFAGTLMLSLAACASAQPSQATLSFRVVASGLSNPVFVTAPAGRRGTIYVVEKTGKVIVFVNGKRRAQPFLDLLTEYGSPWGIKEMEP